MTPKEISPPPPAKKKLSISLRWLMILGFGGLVALAIALVLTMSVATNFSNTYSLLNARALLLIDTMERSIRSQTDQAEHAVKALARLHDEGELTIGQLDKVASGRRDAKMKSFMVASPVIEALLIYDNNGNRSGMFRDQQDVFRPIPFSIGPQNEVSVLLNTDIPKEGEKPVWGKPVIVDNILFHNVGYPLRSNGEIVGFAIAAIGQSNMNKIIVDLGRDNATTAFVLTSDNKVIAHSQNTGFFKGRPIIDIESFPDQALRQFPTADQVEELDGSTDQNMAIYESGRGFNKSGFVFIIRDLAGYSAKPYRLGAYFGKAEMGEEVRRILRSIIAGMAALAFAVIASILFSGRLSKPMKKIANVANDFSNLELDNFTPLPTSRVREIDDQTKAMNSMHTALREFSHYVPRTLVKRLMASGTEATRSVEREVTIMFADIVGFTSMSEDLNAIDTASLLNSHFDMLCKKIDLHKGTVDKFIGDGLMAFWGAPDADDDQAANAIKAASDIIDVLTQLNIDRDKNTLPPMRLRIGIHTGRVVVGNIGSCDRHNYTIVGDAVNVAQRLEQLGKQFIGDSEIIIMTSHTTWEKAGKPEFMSTIGMQKLRGRDALIDTYAMDNSTIDITDNWQMKESG